ncbi:MAG: alpha-amylase family protein [Nakamurella sp.]
MSERWYKEAVIYCVEVDLFADSDGDGYGDLPGLISRLDYLERLGVTCLWLNPIHPSPHRDDGYDVADYYGIDPKLGSLGDFAELTLQARARGMRIIIDLVVNHTSDRHPWFHSSRSDPDSRYRDWYVWSDDEPADRFQGTVFPGAQTETWTYDKTAKSWYFHRFYDFQPDLNWQNPAVRAEIKKVMGFWLRLGVAGFRLDAAPFVLEVVTPGVDHGPKDYSILDDMRQDMQWRSGDSVLLCEANVDPADLPKYTGDLPAGPNDRAQMLFSFLLNPRMWLALARGEAESLVESLKTLPSLQAMAQWATFLRNHDELDLSRLSAEQRDLVFSVFAPSADMRLYHRGIRRRLAPMLRGDRRHIELAYALQFSMPGTPVLRYGDEIGMGENLSLPDRNAIRTPMQWNNGPNGGFSTADPQRWPNPMSTRGRYGSHAVNVRAQQRDPDSLLRWFEQLISVVKQAPEIGVGNYSMIDVALPTSVLAHRFDAPEGSIVLLHNLADRPVIVEVGKLDGITEKPWEIFADGPYTPPTTQLRGLELRGWGYRWIRLRHGRPD